MVKIKIVGVGLLLLAGIAPSLSGQVGPPVGGGGGACTNLGCMKLAFMYSPPWAGLPQRIRHFPVNTGRYVRNTWGIQGGSPCALGGTQLVQYEWGGLPPCQPPFQPDPFAIHSSPVVLFNPLTQTFGRYGCREDGAGKPCI